MNEQQKLRRREARRRRRRRRAQLLRSVRTTGGKLGVRNRRRRRKNTISRAPAGTSYNVTNSGALKRLRIKHREFIQDIETDGSNFTAVPMEVNPGLSDTFPWLSIIAGCFETYRFNSLTFEYIPTCSTSTDGGIALCPDYDAADDGTSVTKQHLFTFEDSARGNLWAKTIMKCSTGNLHKMKQHFIRNGALDNNLDIKTYDVLKLYIGTSSVSTQVCGELWVNYDITLITPQLQPYSPDEIVLEENSVGVRSVTQSWSTDTTVVGALKEQIKNTAINDIDFYLPGKWIIDVMGQATGSGNITGINSMGKSGTGTLTLLAKSYIAATTGQFNITSLLETTEDVSKEDFLRLTWTGVTQASGVYDYLKTHIVKLSESAYQALLTAAPGNKQLEQAKKTEEKQVECGGNDEVTDEILELVNRVHELNNLNKNK